MIGAPGLPKDDALPAAQLELICAPVTEEGDSGEPVEGTWSSPYYWTAFQIIGDWR